ncbi:MAG: hypothetical protein NVSMB2_20150 [Chloroflexota bacterium]
MRLLVRTVLALGLISHLSVLNVRAEDAQAAPANPTVRLWATREGLVGRTTAAGHLIVPNDQFAALPSRSALNRTVTITYKANTTTVPILDVGPWNKNDAWWETGTTRGQFPDLPRFVPEAWAAYENGYNNGRDATGRYVTFPSMIDLADGTYASLGLQQADWVDVLLTWVNAPSPPPLAPADRKITKRVDPSPAAVPRAPNLVHDERYFGDTGFRIDDDAVWEYFTKRGRVPVFGFPVSRTFVLLGCRVQVFQRQIAQNCAGRGVALMNLLDPDMFPYDRVNGSDLPPSDPVLKAQTPQVGTASYGSAMMDFIRSNAPDSFDGLGVGFSRTFFGLITAAMAGTDNPLLNLEIWGAPISRPRRDPANANFVYQRFQRAVLHYDATTNRTQGLLLADYVKAIMRGKDLPSDLAQAARASKFLEQYCPAATRWLCRPTDLPATDLTYAFETG